MSTSQRRCVDRVLPTVPALACTAVLSGCSAMGELLHHRPWGWVAATVAVLAVVGFIVSRMRR